MNKMLFAITFSTFIALISACSPEVLTVKTGTPDYQWVQLGEEGAVIVRAIFKQSGQNCPNIDTTYENGNTAPVAMTSRATTMPDNFAVTVCEATLLATNKLKSATLGGKTLTLPAKSSKRIVVIGDTGCRIIDSLQQNCNNNPAVSPEIAEEWLFTKSVESAIKLNPDLVIHVGDFIYREGECKYQDRCGGSPYGQNWATWEADFFSPAKSLLETVPWIFARGNHESCQREWRGWYLFLDPHSLTNNSWTVCASNQERSNPFQIPLDGLDLLVMDTADEAGLTDYQTALNKHTGSSAAWFITHRPFWGIGDGFNSKPQDGVIHSVQKANVKLLVSGHTHLFEMIQFVNNYVPPQMIAGGGATELDRPPTQDYFTQEIENFKADLNNSEYLRKFTFVLVEVQSDGWHITVIDEDGTTERRKFVINNT